MGQRTVSLIKTDLECEIVRGNKLRDVYPRRADDVEFAPAPEPPTGTYEIDEVQFLPKGKPAK